MKPIVTRPTTLFLLVTVGWATSFYLLLTPVPTYVAGSTAAAGLTTGTLMLTTVVAELAAPSLIARFGRRAMLAAGLILLGLPTLGLLADDGPAVVLAVCALRGLGFGLAVVIGSSWMALLAPPDRRGLGLGVYGVAVGIPAIIALPLGVWLSQRVGYPSVFLAGAAAALVGLVPLAFLSDNRPAPDAAVDRVLRMVGGLRTPSLTRPALAFATTAAAAGVLVTFLPSAVTGPATAVVAPALLAHSAGSTVARWCAGRYGDHVGAGRVLVASIVVVAAGVAMLALTGSALAILAGAVLLGIGFGAAQNASITVMFGAVSTNSYDTASAVWNIGYDAGMGLGAAAFGLLAVHTGFPLGFVLIAALIPASFLLLRSRSPVSATSPQ